MQLLKSPFLLLFLLICQLGYSQDQKSLYLSLANAKSDSNKVKIYLDASSTYLKLNKNEAKKFAQKAIQLCQKNNFVDLKIQSLLCLADAIRYTGNIEDLFNIDIQAIQEAKKANNNLHHFTAVDNYAKDLISFNRLDEALYQINQMKVLEGELKDDYVKAKLLFTQGLYYFKLQNLKEAEKMFKGSAEIALKINDNYLLALNKLRIFNVKVYSGVIDESATQAFEAQIFFKANNYPEDMAYAHFLIGDSYRFHGNLVKAYSNYSLAYDVFIRLQNHLLGSGVQSAFFQGYMLQQDMKSAKKSLLLLQNHFSKLNYLAGQGMGKIFWGRYYSANSEFAKADSLFSESTAIADKLNLQSLKAVNAVMIAQHLERQNKSQQADSVAIVAYGAVQKSLAKELFEKGFETPGTKGKLNGNQKNEKRLYVDSNFRKQEGLRLLQSMRKNKEENLTGTAYRPLLSVFDSSLTVTYNNQLLNIETQYKTRLLSDSLRGEQQNAIIAQQQMKNNNIILFSVIAISLLLLAGFALQVKSRKRAEKDKQHIQLLQDEIHHRVKNNLGVIQRLVDVAGKNAVDDVPLSSLKTRIKSIELLHTHLYSQQAKPGNISLQAYLEDLCLAIATTFETGKNIKINVQASEELNGNIAEKLGLIVNEVVTNSYKYAFEGKKDGVINITAQKDEKNIRIAVQDNGIGFETEKTKNNYGMRLIKGLSHELNAKYIFLNNSGTQFQLSIPV